jgi:hypothetical protein
MTPKPKEIEWWTLDDGESIGKFLREGDAHGDYLCPKCNKPCNYWEGTIDQDRQGNDITGWAYHCYECGLGCEAEYLD